MFCTDPLSAVVFKTAVGFWAKALITFYKLDPCLQHHPVPFRSRNSMSHWLAPRRSLSVSLHEGASEKKLTGHCCCKNIRGCNGIRGDAESLKALHDSAEAPPPLQSSSTSIRSGLCVRKATSPSRYPSLLLTSPFTFALLLDAKSYDLFHPEGSVQWVIYGHNYSILCPV